MTKKMKMELNFKLFIAHICIRMAGRFIRIGSYLNAQASKLHAQCRAKLNLS